MAHPGAGECHADQSDDRGGSPASLRVKRSRASAPRTALWLVAPEAEPRKTTNSSYDQLFKIGPPHRPVSSIAWEPASASSWSATLPHAPRSEEHTSELQYLMRISYPVLCLKTKNSMTQ